MNKTRKNILWKGWKNERPSYAERTKMLKSCGKKCFLGKNKSFPICKKNSCKVSKKGLYAAYIRSRQYSSKGNKYKIVASKSRKMIDRMK